MSALRLLPEFEESLRSVPGIRQASVVTDPEARPVEVHVVSNGGKPAKAVVRDVQAVASAQFDLDIDHRIVSVVEIPDGQSDVGDPTPATEAPIEASAPRPALTSISVMRNGGDAEVSVTLSIGTHVLSGTADGPSGQIHRARIVAQATLNALTELLGIAAQIESAQVVEAGVREVAVTTLTLEIPRLGEQILCGSALVRGDAEDAVARSVLAAVNRRLAG
jgi:hypothetical protein